MKVSEMIQELEAFKATHGDLEVETDFVDGSRVTQRHPVLDFRMILKGREWKPRFHSNYDGREPGEPVCRL